MVPAGSDAGIGTGGPTVCATGVPVVRMIEVYSGGFAPAATVFYCTSHYERVYPEAHRAAGEQAMRVVGVAPFGDLHPFTDLDSRPRPCGETVGTIPPALAPVLLPWSAPAPAPLPPHVATVAAAYRDLLMTLTADELETARATMAQACLTGPEVEEYRRLIRAEFRHRGATTCLGALSTDGCDVPVLGGALCCPECSAAGLDPFTGPAVPVLDPDTPIDSLPDGYGDTYDTPIPGCCVDCDDALALIAAVLDA